MTARTKQLLALPVLLAMLLTACTDYGKKVTHGHVDVYYKNGITEDVAQKTADLAFQIDKEQNNNTTEKKSIQLLKNGDTVVFRMVADAKKMEKITDEPFITLANFFSDSLYKGAPVNVELTDNKFKTVHHVTYQKVDLTDANRFGNKITNGNIELYCEEQLGAEVCNHLAEYLNNYFKPETVFSFQFSKNDNGDFVVNMASDAEKAGQVTREQFTDICTRLSNDVFNGSPLIFQLTDTEFKPLSTFAYPSDANQ